MVTVLMAQLVLSMLAPPFQMGERKLFLGDVWFLIWTAVGFVQYRRILWKKLLLPGAVVAIAYVHGRFREELPPQFGLEPFQAGRELVIAVRFLSWLTGGFIVGHWFRQLSPAVRARAYQSILRTLGTLGALIVVTMVASKFFLPLEVWLGKLYGYDPFNISWQGRLYGTFSSPNEAAVTLGLAGLLFATEYAGPQPVFFRAISVLMTGVGITLAKASTPFISLLGGISASYASQFRRSTRWLLLGLAVAAVTLALFLSPRKLGHLSGRVDTWIFHLRFGAHHWDSLLFGQGFHTLNVDNFYLFHFSRGGLVAMAALLGWIAWVLVKNVRHWNFQQRAVVLFGLIAGLSLDVFILRPFVAVWVVAAVPLLCLPAANKPRARKA